MRLRCLPGLQGDTPLHEAARWNTHSEVAAVLAACGPAFGTVRNRVRDSARCTPVPPLCRSPGAFRGARSASRRRTARSTERQQRTWPPSGACARSTPSYSPRPMARRRRRRIHRARRRRRQQWRRRRRRRRRQRRRCRLRNRWRRRQVSVANTQPPVASCADARARHKRAQAFVCCPQAQLQPTEGRRGRWPGACLCPTSRLWRTQRNRAMPSCRARAPTPLLPPGPGVL